MTIRRAPEEFDVEELVREDVARGWAASASKSRRFAVYRLTKVSLTTLEAAARLAAGLGVEPGLVVHAGLKDRHARTSQHVSAAVGGGAPAKVEGEGWSAELVGWSPEEARAGWIRRNRFRIVVRGLDAAAAARMDERARLLEMGPGRLLVVNYFGDQRFGSARHGGGFAAQRLIEGDFEGALRLLIGTPSRKDTGARRVLARAAAGSWGDWRAVLDATPRCPERRAVEVLARGDDYLSAFSALPHATKIMCVEAYQSHLWNEAARELARSVAGGNEAIVVPGQFGEMVFPAARVVGHGTRGVEMPMPSPAMRAVEPWGAAMNAALAREGVSAAGLRIPGVRRPRFGEAWRPLFVMAERFSMTAPGADELGEGMKRIATFELPRGAYATVVLRSLGA